MIVSEINLIHEIKVLFVFCGFQISSRHYYTVVNPRVGTKNMHPNSLIFMQFWQILYQIIGCRTSPRVRTSVPKLGCVTVKLFY